jgi:hypothetical protein
MRKITILGLVLGFIFSSFGQIELFYVTEKTIHGNYGSIGYIAVSSDAGVMIEYERGDIYDPMSNSYDIVNYKLIYGKNDSSRENLFFEDDFNYYRTIDIYRNLFGEGKLNFCINKQDSINSFGIYDINGNSKFFIEDVNEVNGRIGKFGNDYILFLERFKDNTTTILDSIYAYSLGGSSNILTESQTISVEDTLNVDLVTAVGEVSQNELRVWNDNNIIHYQVDEAGDFQVLIFNTNAQLQHQNDNFTGINGEFDASNLSSGMYFITINDNNEVLRSETKKIVIR